MHRERRGFLRLPPLLAHHHCCRHHRGRGRDRFPVASTAKLNAPAARETSSSTSHHSPPPACQQHCSNKQTPPPTCPDDGEQTSMAQKPQHPSSSSAPPIAVATGTWPGTPSGSGLATGASTTEPSTRRHPQHPLLVRGDPHRPCRARRKVSLLLPKAAEPDSARNPRTATFRSRRRRHRPRGRLLLPESVAQLPRKSWEAGEGGEGSSPRRVARRVPPGSSSASCMCTLCLGSA